MLIDMQKIYMIFYHLLIKLEWRKVVIEDISLCKAYTYGEGIGILRPLAQ